MQIGEFSYIFLGPKAKINEPMFLIYFYLLRWPRWPSSQRTRLYLQFSSVEVESSNRNKTLRSRMGMRFGSSPPLSHV